MIILGATSEDKGNQLEQMAQAMLTGKGYGNIRLNAIGAGGTEYDVTGDYEIPSVTSSRRIQLIGECKARRDPINMTDWQKFMGKIYLENTKRNQEVAGLLVTLSGMNGPVAASYQEYRELRSNIEVVVQSDIENFLQNEYSVCNLQDVARSLSKFTQRTASSIELCYYRKQCCWLVRFEKEAYTILDAKGQPLNTENLATIRELLEAETVVSDFVNLEEEAEALRRAFHAKKHVLGRLMLYNGVLDEENLLKDSPFPPDETLSAVTQLEEEKWVESSEDSISFADMDSDGRYAHIVPVLAFWLNGETLTSTLYDGLDSQFYDRHIDIKLLETISKIQGNLPFTQEQQQKIIAILKLSPQALNRAINPNQFVINGRADEALQSDARINEVHYDIFIEYITDGLVSDYKNPLMSKYHGLTRGIVELQQYQRVIVKRPDDIAVEVEWQSRHLIRASNVQGGFLHLLALKSEPEPWERTDSDSRVDLDFDSFT